MTDRDVPGLVDAAFWRDRPVLVTGAHGFLGAHVARLLVEAGAALVVIRRDRVPDLPHLHGWQSRSVTVEGDVRNQDLVERVLGEYDVSTVLHLAAQSQVGASNRNPVSTFESNIRGTWSVLEACRRSPLVEHVVVASSDKAYGPQETLPYTEDTPLRADNPYDVSKASADMIALSYHRTFGLPVSVTRCGNFFGPGDTNWNRIVPGTIRSLLRRERPVIRSDGTLIRDYLYVIDGALAYLRLAEAMGADAEATVGQPFNFSSDEALTVLELVALVADAVGVTDVEPDVQAIARNEIHAQHLSSEKARTMLGWKPLWSTAEALVPTVEWYRELLGGGA